jgi:hypothetical protein
VSELMDKNKRVNVFIINIECKKQNSGDVIEKRSKY